MRADRLVATLLILQAKGRVTAAQVAAELEVSERTARRDLEALGMAGLPVYPLRGRGGGWELAGGGRTDLSGLNAAEARTLFRLAGPAAATPVARAALRKLIRALPEPMRAEAQAAATSIVVDPSGWDRDRRPPKVPPALDAVQDAVVKGTCVTLGYVARDGAATERVVHPLGLAAKGDHWYLVAATDAGLRTFRVDRVTAAVPTGEPVVRPDGFDLAEAWRAIVDEVEERRTPVRAYAHGAVEVLPLLRYLFGRRLEVGPPSGDQVEVVIRGHSLASLVVEIGGLGGRLTVTGPDELRSALARLGADLLAAYGGGGAPLPAGAAAGP
ncbi:MAG TPA: WYL domain-containing protein [Acidimicrobiales bacterium]|nr:WYL domain-containing protein [Acidimicrobiales bacterium]